MLINVYLIDGKLVEVIPTDDQPHTLCDTVKINGIKYNVIEINRIEHYEYDLLICKVHLSIASNEEM